MKGTDNLATLGTVNKNTTAYQLPIDESSADEEAKKQINIHDSNEQQPEKTNDRFDSVLP